MKMVVIVFILLIVASMASALFFMVRDRDRDKGASTRTVRALTWRVVFSIALFAMLMLGFHFGLLPNKL